MNDLNNKRHKCSARHAEQSLINQRFLMRIIRSFGVFLVSSLGIHIKIYNNSNG